MGNFVGLTDYNTLGRGATNLGHEAGNLRSQLQSLVSELESSRDVMEGNQAGAFDRAKARRAAGDTGVDCGSPRSPAWSWSRSSPR